MSGAGVPADDAPRLLVVLTTFPDVATADRIAAELVERRLAACVTLLPGAVSRYRWQDRTETASEVVGLIKTTPGRLAELEKVFAALHPYDVPEFVVTSPDSVSAAYARWAAGAVA